MFSRHLLGQYLFQSTPTNHYPFIKSRMLKGKPFSCTYSSNLIAVLHSTSSLITSNTPHFTPPLLPPPHLSIPHSSLPQLFSSIRYIGQQLRANPPHLSAI